MSLRSKYADWEIDALTEVCNIGAGHAATALSQLLGRKMMISVPKIDIVALSDLPDAFGGAETIVTAVYVRILGEAPGSMLFILSRESSSILAAALKGSTEPSDSVDETDLAIIKQAAVVTVSSYLSALTQFLKVPLISSEAGISSDMVGALLDIVITELGAKADYGLVMQTDFIAEFFNISAKLCFLPDPEAEDVIMKILQSNIG